MNPMWNKSEQILGFKLARMTCRLVLLLSLMEFNSGYKLSEVQDRFPLVCPSKSCPKGYSSFCPPNEPARCKPCGEGTFSPDSSRKTTCRPCSRCRDNEYELRPCTSTSNVVCKECSQCPSGFEVVQSCDGTRDTVCRDKCHSPLPFEDELGIECIKTGEQFNGEHSQKKAEKGKTKDSMTIIEVENPLWANGTRKPGKQLKPSIRFSGVQPTPQSPYSNSPYSTEAIVTVPTHSVDTLTHPFVIPRTSALGAGKSIGHSHTTKDSAKFLTGSVPNVKRKESLPIDVLQGDQPISRRPIRRHSEENRTREIPSFSPKPEPLDGSMPNIDETNFVEPNVSRRKPKDITTVPFWYTGVREGYEMAGPGNRGNQVSSPASVWTSGTVGILATVGTVGTVVVVLFVLLVFRVVKRSKPQQGSRGCVCRSGLRSRRPRCPGSSNCCQGNSVSSVAVACSTDQNDRNPTYTTYTIQENEDFPNSCQTTQITEITADVHRNTVFDLFPAIRGTDQGVCVYPQFITHAEKTFHSSGGQLSHPDSNVVINIESGTISEGNSQRIFFRVVNNDTWLLRDIPETCQRSLISPVIQCGPEDINPLKPVEIVLPHCLYVDEVKKTFISVFRCGEFSDCGPVNWEKVPLASEKNSQSKAWFTVKRDSIVIKTKTFSFWSVFACGGPKRKRATAFASKPNPNSDLISLRFYIYSDNEDSKRKVERIETERFIDSKPVAMERPFKMFNDSKDITVWLDTEALAISGWELDHTPATQTYIYEMAYRNGYRSYEACCFSVKPIPSRQAYVDGFSCNLYFQQDDHPHHFLYVNPGITPLAQQDRSPVLNNSNGVTITQTPSEPDQETPTSTETGVTTETAPPEDEQEPVTQTHCLCICNHVGTDWKPVLRFLDMDETVINNLDEDNRDANVSEKCYQGLLQWKNSTGSREATIGKLRHALRQTGCTTALEKLSSRDDGLRLATIPESTTDVGASTCV